MLRIYLDSNVYRYIKPKHPSDNKDLHSLMDELVGELLFIYSSAHLDDLKTSADPYRTEDLKLMEKYVNTNYFARDPIKNVTDSMYSTPIEAFSQIDYHAMDQILNNFDVDTVLFKDLDDRDDSEAFKSLLKSVFDMPITAFGTQIDLTKIEGVHKEWFDKMIPNYSSNMSLKDFLNSVMLYGGTIINDAKEVTDLRSYVESYYQSDTYNYQTWGMKFNEKLRDKFGKSFLELIDGMLLGKQKSNRFLRFQKAYGMLEVFNITKETASGKTKKFNYWSLNNDATHCYFASLCDYLVTDDKGMQVKAQIMYNLFGVPTRILSTKDFVEMKDDLLDTEKTLEAFVKQLAYNISNSTVFHTCSVIETREKVTFYQLTKLHFGIFDVMECIEYTSGSIRCVLNLIRDAPEITLMRRELQLVSRKILRALGQDQEDKGEFGISETPTIGRLRVWVAPRMVFQLALEQEEGAFFIKLYVDIHPEQVISDSDSKTLMKAGK